MSQSFRRLAQDKHLNHLVDFLLNFGQSFSQWAGNKHPRIKSGQSWAKDAGVQTSEEQGHLATVGRELIALGLGHPPDDAFQTQPAQIIGESTGRVRLKVHGHEVSHQGAQRALGEALRRRNKGGKCRQEGHAAGLGQSAGRRTLTVRGDGR